MSKRFFSAAGMLTVIGLVAIGLAGVELRSSPNGADQPKSWGFDTANLDKTCKPCDDFYQFAMGGWMKANPVPPTAIVVSKLAPLIYGGCRETVSLAGQPSSHDHPVPLERLTFVRAAGAVAGRFALVRGALRATPVG